MTYSQDKMTYYAVDPSVGNVKNNSPTCVTPIPRAPQFASIVATVLANLAAKVRFAQPDPLCKLVSEADDAVQKLHGATHYLNCKGV